MQKTYKSAIFIFRRDLRIIDNSALNTAFEQSETVLPCFIFDPKQVGDKNPYKSTNSVQFMIESLQELASEIKKKDGKLYVFYGDTQSVVNKLLKIADIDALFINQDYTPFSKQRDATLKELCTKQHKSFHSSFDTLLVDPEFFLNKQGKPYTVFTPFFKAACKLVIASPKTVRSMRFFTKKIPLKELDLKKELTSSGKILKTTNKNIAVHGGRSYSAKILNNLEQFKDYTTTHDVPSIQTTQLSAYNKFGTHSIREVAYATIKDLGHTHPLLRQLYWRDFYYHILWHFSFVLGSSFRAKYNKLTWSNSTANFTKWCNGSTGFPIVDAGMRQLNATGFMHNRVRMIVASFLTKDLHIDWQKGEKYFAQQLVDYDPAVNNGNWQWVASTGCDPQPYFRIFNPWLQQKKFDPECVYIKTWLPELKKYSAKEIHNHATQPLTGYPKPIIEHAKEKVITLKAYKKVK